MVDRTPRHRRGLGDILAATTPFDAPQESMTDLQASGMMGSSNGILAAQPPFDNQQESIGQVQSDIANGAALDTAANLSRMQQSIAGETGAVWDSIQSHIDNAGTWLDSLWNRAVAGVENIGPEFQSEWTQLQNYVGSIGRRIDDEFNSAGADIGNFFGNGLTDIGLLLAVGLLAMGAWEASNER